MLSRAITSMARSCAIASPDVALGLVEGPPLLQRVGQNRAPRQVVALLRQLAGMGGERIVFDDLPDDVARADARIGRLGQGGGRNDGGKSHGSKKLVHNKWSFATISNICGIAEVHCGGWRWNCV